MSATTVGQGTWLAHGWGVRVRTPDELMRVISNVGLLAPKRSYAWRGQNDAAWDLSPSLLRHLQTADAQVTEDQVRARELEILSEARRWGLGRNLGASASDMHLLAVLQHHGVPTRFLDVTANPMTALWFATEEHRKDDSGNARRSPGVLFAIDVTVSDWYETFLHSGPRTYMHLADPLGAAYESALIESLKSGRMFRAYPALPDERMVAQEGYFIASAIPTTNRAPGVFGFNPSGPAPGEDRLRQLLSTTRSRGRPINMPFCAIVIPARVKDQIRILLKRSYNRRRRVLFPDVDGFREGFIRGQLD